MLVNAIYIFIGMPNTSLEAVIGLGV
uniref:Uncharacterized protein n=1 Tax=Moniliophthora roreri TaxID=221103 RepID=A0A0W0FVA3_MONRR